MSGRQMRLLGPAGRPLGEPIEAGIGAMLAIGLAAVLLEVTVMPYIRLFDGIPDLIAAAVVGIALMRGPFAGAVAGFSMGMAVELTAPIGTLGALALLYLIAGAFCGRYCGRPEASGLVAPVALAVAAAGFVQIGYLGLQLLLDVSVSAGYFTARILLTHMLLTALLSPPVLLIVRRALRGPRVLEPFGEAA